MRVAVIAPHYLPGTRAGGPVRSIASLVETLGDEIEFFILTHDHDFGTSEPYPGVVRGQPVRVGKASVVYLSEEDFRPKALEARILASEPDALYLNSFFHPLASIGPVLRRKFGGLHGLPLLIAPRGEFAEEALRIKGRKKSGYLALARVLSLYRDVIWQASSEFEAADIHRVVGREAKVRIAHLPPSLPQEAEEAQGESRRQKSAGSLQLIFVGRFAPMKNVEFALSVLAGVEGKVRFELVGPKETEEYWRLCQDAARRLPLNVQVEFAGALPHDEVLRRLNDSHAFLLPTRGENFGHGILEAMSCGCPVVISQNTQWRDLAPRRAGWDLPLSAPGQFTHALQRLADMESDEWLEWSRGAREYARGRTLDADAVEATRRLFLDAARVAPARRSRGSSEVT